MSKKLLLLEPSKVWIGLSGVIELFGEQQRALRTIKSVFAG